MTTVPRTRLKPALVVLLTITMAALVFGHVHGVNGSWYWQWSWRKGAFRLSWLLFPAMLLAAIPFAVGQYLYTKRKWNPTKATLVLAIGTFALQLTAIAFQSPTGLHRLTAIVRNAVNTSYYTDAVILHQQENISTWEWLYQYPDIVPLLHLHAKYKPPGLVLYYAMLVKLFGEGALAATVGGIGIAILASLAVPATYRFVHFYSRDSDAAFCAASYMALCPSLILFLPQFDQVYPLIACAILVLYGILATQYRLRAAIALGAVLALALFMSYIFLIFGLFMLAHWMIQFADRGPREAGRAIGPGIVAIGTFLGLYGLLWILTGFDPIRTFNNIAESQAKDLLPLIRPFPRHIFFDVLDLALGTAWISFLLILFLLVRWKRGLFARQPSPRLVLLVLLQIGTVALAALLPGETARLWLCLMPLLMAPVGIELATWPVRSRWVVYACVWLLMVVLCQNMTFIYMGPELDGPRW